MKIKSILISQPKPTTDKSPYFDLAKRLNLKVDFRPFIHVESMPIQEFRKQRISILEYSAVILTSRNAVDHFFKICEESRLTVPEGMKYFCTTEAIAFYLQKYVVYRKRKIFYGSLRFHELMPVLKKHKKEKFLLPCSDVIKPEMTNMLTDFGILFKAATFYRTVASDLSDLTDVNYDLLVFYSPSGIESLMQNFPDFKQNNTKIAAFGTSTAKAVDEAGLKLDIEAPQPNKPSMTMAIESYIKDKK